MAALGSVTVDFCLDFRSMMGPLNLLPTESNNIAMPERWSAAVNTVAHSLDLIKTFYLSYCVPRHVGAYMPKWLTMANKKVRTISRLTQSFSRTFEDM